MCLKTWIYTIDCLLTFIDFPGINPVTVEEAQSLVHGADLKYVELSQTIHPILGTPFLYLHPCMSHELLQITSKRYVDQL